jgi:diguanylate cyclase (GGDEF)-like protein
MRSLILFNEEFTETNQQDLYQRIKLISYMLIITYPCFFIADLFFFSKSSNLVFKFNLSAVHLLGAIVSLLFIIINRFSKKLSKTAIIHFYVFFYLIIGAAASLNSQLFTGNIDAYIIIFLAVAVIFPIRPKNLAILYAVVQAIFSIGLFLMTNGHFAFLSKFVNSTGAVVISFIISLTFYTYRKNDFLNKQKLKRNEESFRRLFNMNPNPLILAKWHDSKILLMNKSAVQYYELEGRDYMELDVSIFFPSQKEWQNVVSELEIQQSIKNFVTELQITPEKSQWSILSLELVNYLDETCVLIGSTDITEIKKKETELLKHATIDVLTGVMNRRSGMELLHKLFCNGTCSREFIISYVDINNLKKVNDMYGHTAGDKLIKTSCDVIKHHIETEDVLFRLGGDEFIIIFFEKQMEAVTQFINNIKREFQSLNDNPYQISASFGLYHYVPGTITTVEEILEIADQEMYKDKLLSKQGV